MSRGTDRYSFDDESSDGGRSRLPWSDDRTTSQTPPRRSAVRVVAVPRQPATSASDFEIPAPDFVLDAPEIPAQQSAASPSHEEYRVAPPKRLDGVIGLVAAGVGLMVVAFLGRSFMLAPATVPVSAAVVAPPSATTIAPVPPPTATTIAPVPPPTATSIAPVPPSAAPPSNAPARAVAAPVRPPMAAAAPQRHVRTVPKPTPPVERPSLAASPATSEDESEPEAEAAPVEPAEDAEPGTLRINSLPWAQVFLDGRLLGNTPLRGVRVPAGPHSLRLVNHQFSMVKTSEIEVPAGEELTIVERLDD